MFYKYYKEKNRYIFMDNVNLSPLNVNYLNNADIPNPGPKQVLSDVPMKEDGTNKLKLALVGIGAVAAAGVGLFALSRGKAVKLEGIDFNKGFAKLKDQTEGFTGKIKDVLPNGDKITLEYKDGFIQKSIRRGSKNFEKVFETVDSGYIIKTTAGGKTTETNITSLQNAVKNAQNELKKIISNQDELSLSEFKSQTSKIQYKTKAQQNEVESIINTKTEAARKQFEYERVNKKLEDITFDKGIAIYNGLPWGGKIHCTLKNDDKVVIETNVLGRIKRSERTGSNAFVKEYDPLYNTVRITKDGKTETLDLNSLKEKALKENKIRVIDITQNPKYSEPMLLSGYTYYDALQGHIGMDEGLPVIDAGKLKLFESLKDITPNSIAESFGKFEGKYDLPDKFMIAVNNQIRKTGSGLIVEEVPKMFEGIKTSELAGAIDKIPFFMEEGG